MSASNAQKKVDECLEIIDKLGFSDWEERFLNDMKVRLRFPGFVISPKQQKVLDDLYDRACASPY